MAIRRLGCVFVAVLAIAACKSKDGGKGGASAADLDKRCEGLAKACADTDKHVQMFADECKAAAKTQVQKGCNDLAIALYNCSENAVCGAADKVWALGDLKVLATRHKKCDAEQTALDACMK